MAFSYPQWLQKTGKPILWAFKSKPELVSRGTVLSRRSGRVYIAGEGYGTWQYPENIIEIVENSENATD